MARPKAETINEVMNSDLVSLDLVKLNLKTIPQWCWDNDQVAAHVDEYEEGEPEKFNELETLIHGLLLNEISRPRGTSARKSNKNDSKQEYLGNEIEQAYAEAVKKYFEYHYSQLASVKHFRASLPGSTLLSEEDAQHLLRSPLTQLCSFKQLSEWGIDPLLSKCDIVDRRIVLENKRRLAHMHLGNGSLDYINIKEAKEEFTIRITPNGIEKTVRHPLTDYFYLDHRAQRCVGYTLCAYAGDAFWKSPPGRTCPLKHYPIQGYLGTIAGDAFLIAHQIEQYYYCSGMEALQYLLTGILPCWPQISMSRTPTPIFNFNAEDHHAFDTYGPNLIHISPWIRPEEVKDFMDELRETSQRLKTKQSLLVFNFVIDLLAEEEKTKKHLTWKERHEKWKLCNSETPYQSWNNFRSIYEKTKKSILPIQFDYEAFRREKWTVSDDNVVTLSNVSL